MVIPRSVSTDFPIDEPDVYISSQLLITSTAGYSSACQLPSSVGFLGADYVVAVNTKQLINFETGSTTCGMCISISVPGGEPVKAMVIDECPNCASNSIGISPIIYQKLLGLETLPSSSVVTPIKITWTEISCPTKEDIIPTMSLSWSQPSATFSSLKLYGLPFAISQVSISWDSFQIRKALNASLVTWTPLVIPNSALQSTPKALGFWYLPSGVSVLSSIPSPVALKVDLRNGTTLVTRSRSVYFEEDSGDLKAGLWIRPGTVPVISYSASSGVFRRQEPDISLEDAVVQEVIDYGV
ncbi:UNVERIFIED_CONTAM: hypothetical protein HDU68_002215 [Siphonaria sp. JEL0065]|nr:hypothetical protein HDU68_002215 [Siphonaria sp. JEL0065]